MGKQCKQWQTLFSWAPKSLWMVTAAMKLKDPCSLEEKQWQTYTMYWKTETLLCLQSPLDCKQIKQVNPKGNQPWIFIRKTDAQAEAPILWPPDVNNWLIWKDPDAGKDWRQEEKGTTEDELFGWHHWLDEHGFEQVPEVGDRQGSLPCCSSWGHKESDTTEWMNWTELMNVTH